MKIASKPAAHVARRKRPQADLDPAFVRSPLPMWVYDAKSLHVLDVNQAALDACGYEKGEMLAMRLPELVAGAARAGDEPHPDLNENLPRAKAGRVQLRCKDGGLAAFQMTSRALRYNGSRARLVTLTPMQEAEAPAPASASITSSPIGMLRCDARGRILSANEAAARAVGMRREHLPGRSLAELACWPGDALDAALDAALGAPAGQETEVRLSLTGEDKAGLDVRLIPFEQADERGLLVLLGGAGAPARGDRERERGARRYRDLVENAPALICTHDLHGKLLSVNPWAAHVLGYEPDDLVGRDIAELLVPEARAGFAAYLRRIAHRGAANGIMPVLTASGRTRLWEYHNTLRTDERSEPVVHGTAFDITEQHAAEEALRESEQSYKRLFEAAPIGIALTDFDGTLLAFNDALLEPGGYRREDFAAMGNITGLYADASQRTAALALLEKQGYLSKYAVQLKRKNGSVYNALLSLTKLEFHGQLRLQGLIEDMSQRQASEEALRKSEALYRGLFNNALEGMFRTTADGRFVSANPALVHMLGYQTESELLNLKVGDLYANPRRRVHNLERIANTGELRDFELHLRRKDGSTLIALENSRAVLGEDGQVALYEGTLTDITERKQIEEALRDSEGELRALFEAVPDLVLVLDKDGRYINIAPGHDDMLYAPAEELLGRSIGDVFSEPKTQEFLAYIRQTLRTHQPVHFEYPLLIGTQIRWFSGAAAPLSEESVVWVARDITPQKEAEEQVQRRLVELEALYESGLSLGRTLDPREISRRIIEVLTSGLHWHHAEVRVRRGDSEDVDVLAFSEAPGADSAAGAGRLLASEAVTSIGQGMAGWVMRHGRMINSGNLPGDPRYEETFPQMRSGLYVPIWAGGRVLGCISVETQQMDAFREADERLLTTLASQAAAALENARLFAETQERVAESLALYEHTRDLTAQADLGALLQALAERVALLLKVPGGAVYLFDAAQQQLEIVTCTDENLPAGTILRMGEGMAGRVAQSREPLIVDDYRQWDGCPPQFAGQAWAAVLEVPMLYRGELIGVLAAFDVHPADGSDARRKFTDGDVRLISLFASGAAGAIYSARLFDAERLRRQEAETLRAQAVQAAERLAALHAATREIARIGPDIEHVYTSIYQAARRLLPTEAFVIALLDEARQKIRGVYMVDEDERRPSMDIPVNESLTSRVIQSGETLLVNDMESADLQRVHFGSVRHVRSLLAAPLRLGSQVIGAISVQSYAPGVYQPADQVLLEMLAAQVAIAIQNARLFEETSQRGEQFRALYESASALPLQQDARSLWELVLQRASALLGTRYATLYLYDAEQSELVAVLRRGFALDNEPHLKIGEGAAGQVALRREPLIIEDYATWEGRSPHFEGVPFRAVLEVPMTYGGALIGVLSVQEQGEGSTRTFNEADARLLSLFATQAAGVVYNARLLEDTRRRLHEFESLAEVGDALSGTLDLEPLLENILRTARQAIPSAEKGTVLLRGEGEDHHLHVRAQVGYGDARLMDVPFDDSKGYAGRAYRQKRPILIRNTMSEYEIPFGHQFDEVNAVQSAIVAPLIVKGKAIGAIALDNLSRTAAFDEGDLRLLMLFASSAAVAIENARLFQETRRRAAELEVLYEATSDLSSHPPDLRSLLRSLVNKAARLMRSYGAGMYMYEPHTGEVELVAVSEGQEGLGIRLKTGEGAAGRVAQTRSPLVVDDYVTWPGRLPELEGVPFRAHLEVPMLYGGELVGVLEVFEYGDSQRKYNEADIKLLSLFASQAAGALHSARLFEQVSRRASEFETLYQTAADISSQTNMHALLDTVIQRARDLMDAAGAVVYLFDPQDGSVELSAPDDPNLRIGTRLGPGEGLSGKIIQTKQPLIVQDYQAWEGRSPQYEDKDFSSVVGVPMLYSGQLIGVLNVFNLASRDCEHGSRIFTARDASTLELLGNFAAGAVYVARLLEQTRRRVEQLSALHAVDTTISSTTDLRVSLQAVLDGVLRQLQVDAADVLLLNPMTLTLQYAAGSGFFTSEINRTMCALGTGQAGKVALDREIAEVRDLSAPDAGFTRTGLVAAERLKAYIGVPLLAKGEVKGVLEIFQRTPTRFDDERRSLMQILAGQAAIAIDNAQLFEGLEKANLELMMAYDATIEGWSQALELRDQETQGHSNRVLEWTLRMASALGLPDRQLRDIRRGVLLHDIGKMGIPDSILHKPGPLSTEEWQVMRQHPQYAYNMLAPIVYLRNSIDIPYAHHEKWNGEGYPRGLKGETIPLAARIFSVVDVYDALTSNRPYRMAWPEEKALEYIAQQSGKQFDPRIVELFQRLLQG